MSKLTLQVMPVRQGSTVFYQTSIKAGNLTDQELWRIDRWDAVTHEGYQREINQAHAHRLARYLGKAYSTGEDLSAHEQATGAGLSEQNQAAFTNVLPSSIVINFRKPLITNVMSGRTTLEIDEWPGYIIDGQHRIQAIRELIDQGQGMEDYEFPVTITNFSTEEEMIHFRNLNSTANRPPKGLNEAISYQLYSKYGRNPASYQEVATNRATSITMRLSSDIESPWYGRIALGGVRKRSQHTTVQAQFTTSIRAMFAQGRYSDPKDSLDLAYETIRDFWMAVDEVWTGAILNIDSSLIQRPPGYYALNKVLDKVFNNIKLNPTKEDFVEILTSIKDNLSLDDSGWDRSKGQIEQLRRGYSMNRAHTIVADYLWSGVSDTVKHKLSAI